MPTLSLQVSPTPLNQPKLTSVGQAKPQSLTLAKPKPQPKLTVGTVKQPTLAPKVASQPQQGKITQIGTATEQQPAKLSLVDFAQSIKQKYPDYADRDDETLARAMLDKFPEYQDRVFIPEEPQSKEPGLLKRIGQNILRTPIQVVKAGVGVTDLLASKVTKDPERKAMLEKRGVEMINSPTFGEVPSYSVKEGIGKGFELGSYAIGAGGAKSVAEAGLKGVLKEGALQGAKAGLEGGLAAGFGTGLQEEDSGVASVAKSTALGGLFGAITGGALGATGAAAGKLLPANRVISAQQKVAKAGQDIDNLAGKIVQGSTEDIAKAKKALSIIDVSNIKTYDDLAGTLDDQVKALAGKLDDTLVTKTDLFKLKDLSVSKKVGNKTVKHNFVVDALNQLDELYTKTNDPVNKSIIEQIATKVTKEGLVVKDINDLARLYGDEFNAKAFSKISGDPLTSVNAQAFENTRTGVKETARKLFDNPVYESADEELSNLIRTRQLVSNMADKVNQLKQKIQERGFGEKVGRLIGQVIDKFTGGGVGGLLRSYLVPSGGGLKIMNALDLENALSKNLKVINEMLQKNLPEQTIIQKLEGIIQTSSISNLKINSKKVKPNLQLKPQKQ